MSSGTCPERSCFPGVSSRRTTCHVQGIEEMDADIHQLVLAAQAPVCEVSLLQRPNPSRLLWLQSEDPHAGGIVIYVVPLQQIGQPLM
jgi:hypothetical protein